MSACLLTLALLLDALLGEPRWLWGRLPHPAVLMGRAVATLDAALNSGPHRRFAGVVVMTLLGVASLVLGFIIHALPHGWLLELLLAAILLAQRSLVDHVIAVARALRLSLEDARRSVALIVGRDTTEMPRPAVARAAIESASENFSDGVVAPAFWFLLGGLPGLLLYKVTNTADSMIGYRNERYADFGWAAARFDDALNWIPARLTALLIALLHGQMGNWDEIAQDARRHRSPNAGWPEAAMARAIDVSLAGPRSYDGEMRDFAYVHPEGRRDAYATDVDKAVNIIWLTWAALWVISLLIAVA